MGRGVNDIHFFCHFLATNDLFRKLKFRRILTKNSAFSRRIVFSTFLTFICLVFEIFHQIQRKGPQWPRGKIIKCEMQSIILALICVGVKYIVSTSRLGICRDRRDRRSCKIFVSCVIFSRKQRSFLHILQVYTHLNVNFLHNC